MGKVCIFFVKKDSDVVKVAKTLLNGLKERGFEVTSYPRVGDVGSNDLMKVTKEEVEIVITVGGDGTILRAVRIFDAPVAGVKMGGRGILAGVDPRGIEEFLDGIERREVEAVERMRIVAELPGRVSPPALNEVVLLRIEPTKTPTFEIESNDFRVRQRMDGLVVSTPTGSTGHSLSLRGPVVLEGSGILLLNPIAPISWMPCLVLPYMEFSVVADESLYLIVDGQVSRKVKGSEKVKIRRGKPARLVGIKREGFGQLHKLGF